MRGNASTVFDSNTAIANLIDNALDTFRGTAPYSPQLVGDFRIRAVTGASGDTAELVIDNVKETGEGQAFPDIASARVHLRKLCGLDRPLDVTNSPDTATTNDSTPGEEDQLALANAAAD